MIRVVVVDDQSFMRMALRRMIEADGDITVVGEARDGQEAVALARQLKPDAMTMDVEMPTLGGLDACTRIMAEVTPPPAIIMVSAHTQEGAADTIAALRRGAVDFISKSSLFLGTDLARIEAELRPMLRAWTLRQRAARGENTVRRTPYVAPQPPPPAAARRPLDLVLIGASTGGPQALTALLRAMGPMPPPVVIAQHMPPQFAAGMAAMMASDTGLPVQAAGPATDLAAGSVWLIPGGFNGTILRPGLSYHLRLSEAPEGVSPSADRLFETASRSALSPAAVVLTGMGRDGSAGAALLRGRGFPVLAQEPAECVVAGMPEAVIDSGLATAVLPLAGIAAWLARAARTV